ncbi:hypothetical protein B0H15DRAFT_772705 [Mycena belliarum]|uniref:Uncharacterized protein n=1 Tax=Mycena belliarum TaxID=1033014 RepID=A0AAD6XRE3_9AGAR|nr:hypothetical protein B0H15DRAFT_772705 [Mycena belliae]
MLSFAQLFALSRASCRRSFSSPSIVSNAFPSVYSAITIPNQREPNGTNGTWNNKVGDHITGKLKSAEELWRDASRKNVPRLMARPPPDAYFGRSVKVSRGNFAEAAKTIDKILSLNRVRATIKATDRHEKKGPKRRRIKSEQWRKHFAHQVRKNVQLVHKIRRRGA